jgi:hypothetical protein
VVFFFKACEEGRKALAWRCREEDGWRGKGGWLKKEDEVDEVFGVRVLGCEEREKGLHPGTSDRSKEGGGAVGFFGVACGFCLAPLAGRRGAKKCPTDRRAMRRVKEGQKLVTFDRWTFTHTHTHPHVFFRVRVYCEKKTACHVCVSTAAAAAADGDGCGVVW